MPVFIPSEIKFPTCLLTVAPAPSPLAPETVPAMLPATLPGADRLGLLAYQALRHTHVYSFF